MPKNVTIPEGYVIVPTEYNAAYSALHAHHRYGLQVAGVMCESLETCEHTITQCLLLLEQAWLLRASLKAATASIDK